MNTEAIITGSMILDTDTPAALRAISSLFSPMLPMVIIEERRVARGIASGKMVQLPQNRNSAMTLKPRPFPTSSSM